MTIKNESLELHKKYKGKISIESKIKIENSYDLSLAYSPGVSEPCLKIYENPEDVYKYTSKGNIVAVISDGSAVLGLGNIGPQAAIPVMEGKAILFKKFGDVDAIPLCLNTNDVDEIVKVCKILSPSLGGINLEDISAPRCIEIERRLVKELDIPVFHDDQHGTAIVVLAALINCLRLTKKSKNNLKIVVSGTGAAGSAIIKLLYVFGFKKIHAYDLNGVLHASKYDTYDSLRKELLNYIENTDDTSNNLQELLKDADIFIGVSAANILTKEMVLSMNKNPWILALANPNPEIIPEIAKEAGASIICTGRSDYPNQVNNLLVFPGLFRGVLDSRIKIITDDLKLEVAKSIAYIIKDSELNETNLIPSPFNESVSKSVANTVNVFAERHKEISQLLDKV